MQERAKGQSQQSASAKAGFSERTGRRIEQRAASKIERKPRDWRTRPDPLADVWENELVPLLQQAPELTPMTLLEHLQGQYPHCYDDGLLRTLQRRVKHWKALAGAEQAVIFRQQHQPGLLGLSDFTTLKGITITLAGSPFVHQLYQFRLAFSGWCYVQAFPGGESFQALAEGLQNALARLGGCPKEHRTDSLSAAFKNLHTDTTEDLTIRYQELCQHYAMQPSRNNRGIAHENGAIESPHGHVKRRITQALLKRGSTDFPTLAAYQDFLQTIADSLNRRYAKALAQEQLALQPLPASRVCDYTLLTAVVTRSSTINVRLVVYSVPSRLIGQRLTVHLFADRVELYLGCDYVMSLARVYPVKGKRRARRIDYRHLIASLSTKPRAFLHAQLRDDLLPTDAYHTLWQWAKTELQPDKACRWMVGVLKLAADRDCETRLAEHIMAYYQHQRVLPLLVALQQQFGHLPAKMPIIHCPQHALSHYDQLMQGGYYVH